MGSKGSAPPPPTPVEPPEYPAPPDMSGMMEAYQAQMMAMMQGLQQQSQNMLLSMQPPEMPDLYERPDIDWEERKAKLNEMMHTDLTSEFRKRMGRGSTVKTSLLTQGSEPNKLLDTSPKANPNA